MDILYIVKYQSNKKFSFCLEEGPTPISNSKNSILHIALEPVSNAIIFQRIKSIFV